jgi:4-hydroxy-3-polyprenylbenzoate decarboxylase
MGDNKGPTPGQLSRRDVLGAGVTGAGLAAMPFLPANAAEKLDAPPGKAKLAAKRGPAFDTFRDWIAALEDHGLLMTFDEVDQDKYHGTALVYRSTDRYGFYGAPAMRWNKVKIDGEWFDGPVFANHQGHWHCDPIILGLDYDPGEPIVNYRNCKNHLKKVLRANKGAFPQIPPVEVSRDKALCKEVVLEGDDIDITRFPFVKTNPEDGGRYVNTGSVFTEDPEMGTNYGTYRCQIKGPRLLGVNPEPNQTGHKMLMRARERGEEFAHVSIALGQDPWMWVVSGARMVLRRGNEPVDELAVAGGFRGKPMEVVKSETNNMLVPAHAEMIIEGRVPLQEPMLPEGPFGEMFGYLGLKKEENFWMHVERVTHRRNPWFLNAFTGMMRGFVTAPIEALYDLAMKRFVPNMVEFHYPHDIMGVAFMSIDKTAPGQGLEAGRAIGKFIPIAKVIVVVDKDLDVLDRTAMIAAIGARWQPHPASEIIEDGFGIITDPSSKVRGKTSKIIVDATVQWPEEGGPEVYPGLNRSLLESGAPNAINEVDRLFGRELREWGRNLPV